MQREVLPGVLNGDVEGGRTVLWSCFSVPGSYSSQGKVEGKFQQRTWKKTNSRVLQFGEDQDVPEVLKG